MKEEKPKEETPPLSLGTILQARREELKLSLTEVSKAIRINKRYLSQLEEDDESLTCDVYTLGFLKTYARYLSLDQDEICQKFKHQVGHLQLPNLEFSALSPRRGKPSLSLLGFSLVALIAIIIGWNVYQNPQVPIKKPASVPETYTKDEIPPSAPTVPAPTQAVTSSPEPETIETATLTEETIPPETSITTAVMKETTPIPSAALPNEQDSKTEATPKSPQKLVLKVTETAWIEVKDTDDNILTRRIFNPGEEQEFNNPENLTLTTGNGKGTNISYGERTLTLSEKHGEKKVISLDPAKWLE